MHLYTCSTSQRRRAELVHAHFSTCQGYSVPIINSMCSQVRVTNSKFLHLGKSFTSTAEQNSNVTSNFAIIPVQLLPPYFCFSEALKDCQQLSNMSLKRPGRKKFCPYLKQKAACQGDVLLFNSQMQCSSSRFLFLSIDVNSSSNQMFEAGHAICHHHHVNCTETFTKQNPSIICINICKNQKCQSKEFQMRKL